MDPGSYAEIVTSIFSDYKKFTNYLKRFVLYQSQENEERLTSEAVLGCATDTFILGGKKIYLL